MTANTLSNKDRAKVASEVTGMEWAVNIGTKEIDLMPHGIIHWKPSFILYDRRPENCWAAGMLAYWLANEVTSTGSAPTPETTDSRQWNMLLAIARNDTAALEYMAHQMITKGKEDE